METGPLRNSSTALMADSLSRFRMLAYALYAFWISPTMMDSSSRPEFSRFRYA